MKSIFNDLNNMIIFQKRGFGCKLRVSVIQFQVDCQTKELHIVVIILKYRKFFLIIPLLYIRLLGTIKVVVWNLITLMRNRVALVFELIDNWNRI